MSLKRPRCDNDEDIIPNAKRGNTTNDAVHRLARLVDCTVLTSHADLLARFTTITNLLLHEVYLQITPSSDGTPRTELYELLEIEFYLWKETCHEDLFTHGSEQQRRSGQWYFHRAPTRAGTVSSSTKVSTSTTPAGGFRGGTRKGLDLTFGGPLLSSSMSGNTVASRYFPVDSTGPPATSGSAELDSRGGILFRTVRRKSDGKVISGPSLLVDEVLRASGAATIAGLVNDIWGGDTSAWPSHSPSSKSATSSSNASLHLVPIPTESGRPSAPNQVPTVYRSPRIGLDLSHSSIPADPQAALQHPRAQYVARPYRFFMNPELLTANGRGHTFLGVFLAFTVSSDGRVLSDSELKGLLVKRTGLKLPTVENYIDQYRKGLQDGKTRGGSAVGSFLGAKGKGAGSGPATALKMFGALNGVASTSEDL